MSGRTTADPDHSAAEAAADEDEDDGGAAAAANKHAKMGGGAKPKPGTEAAAPRASAKKPGQLMAEGGSKTEEMEEGTISWASEHGEGMCVIGVCNSKRGGMVR